MLCELEEQQRECLTIQYIDGFPVPLVDKNAVHVKVIADTLNRRGIKRKEGLMSLLLGDGATGRTTA